MIFDLIESVKDMSVLFIGDAIIDEYHYVEPLGKSAKEPIIPMRWKSSETFAGGVVAAARHAESFCRKVTVCSAGPVTRKVRFVDADLRKLAEIHYGYGESDGGFTDDHDVTVVTDFGHGAISRSEAETLSGNSKYLAVNAQTNSANIGFNLITKYPKADYIVIDEPEARLAAADRDSPIEHVMRKLANGRCNKLVVTHGKHGAYGWDGTFYHCKAMSEHPIDTMGAGDAFFAVTAPMSKFGGMEELLKIGNAAGALKTQIVGHRKPVTKQELISFLKAHEAR